MSDLTPKMREMAVELLVLVAKGVAIHLDDAGQYPALVKEITEAVMSIEDALIEEEQK